MSQIDLSELNDRIFSSSNLPVFSTMVNNHAGGQRRTVVCPCGYRAVGNPDRIDTILRLHSKKCEDGGGMTGYKSKDMPFSGDTWNGIAKSKHGNNIKKAPTLVVKTYQNGVEIEK